MTNKRFRKTERAIFASYCRLRDYPSAQEVAKAAKVSRSTLFRHHRKVQNIPSDYETFLLNVYIKRMHRFLQNENTDMRVIFFRLLIFVSNHRDAFLTLFARGKKDIIKEMFQPLKSRITHKWKISGNLDNIYNIYENEVLGVFEIWAKHGFSAEFIDFALNDILYLTRTACRSLSPLQATTTVNYKRR